MDDAKLHVALISGLEYFIAQRTTRRVAVGSAMSTQTRRSYFLKSSRLSLSEQEKTSQSGRGKEKSNKLPQDMSIESARASGKITCGTWSCGELLLY